jgi:hypothetical protein
MRGRLFVATAVGLACLVVGFSAAPASAQPTTPIPTPTDPASHPAQHGADQVDPA